MKRSYIAAWLGIFAFAAGALAWGLHGRAYVRRRFFPVAPVTAEMRTEAEFVSVLIPRIRRRPQRFAMSAAELEEILRGLKAAGHITIGLEDVEAFYSRGRLLPPKALLIAFAENDPRGYELSDRALKRFGMRGVAFIRRTAEEAGPEHRQHLTRHAISQMRLTGAWDFGWIAKDAPSSPSSLVGGRAVLDDAGGRTAPADPGPYPLRFIPSERGLNDRHDDPRSLSMVALRTERPARENLEIVSKTWPRTSELSDDFRDQGPGSDWIAGWGVVSMGNKRLALLPTPRHTSAGIFLRGTEKWRDATVEFVLKRYKKEFWAYARLRDEGGFVRVGARDGWWYVEQRAGPDAPVNMLARAEIREGGLPARVRFVVKGASVLVYIDGRMMFGRALRLHPGVDRGQLFLGVYDGLSRSSLAVLSSVRAAPLGEVWVAPKADLGGFDEDRLASLRDEAVYARALSPRWISVRPDGAVILDETQGLMVRSMAGFYACRLAPTADMTGVRPAVLDRRESADRLAGGLAAAARELGAAGINLRLREDLAARPETLSFLRKLREGLNSQRRELKVTVPGAGAAGELAIATDGVLRPSGKLRHSLELLEAVYP